MVEVAKLEKKDLGVFSVIVIDCSHGTTRTQQIAGPDVDDMTALVVTAARHEAIEHCGCAIRMLEQRRIRVE